MTNNQKLQKKSQLSDLDKNLTELRKVELFDKITFYYTIIVAVIILLGAISFSSILELLFHILAPIVLIGLIIWANMHSIIPRYLYAVIFAGMLLLSSISFAYILLPGIILGAIGIRNHYIYKHLEAKEGFPYFNERFILHDNIYEETHPISQNNAATIMDNISDTAAESSPIDTQSETLNTQSPPKSSITDAFIDIGNLPQLDDMYQSPHNPSNNSESDSSFDSNIV